MLPRPNIIQLSIEPELFNKISYIINERISIFEKKESGATPPYTADPILSQFRFCNIYRELDRQTVFFHELLKPFEDNPELWILNMLFCRSVCSPATIQQVGLLSFNQLANTQCQERLLNMKSPKYGTAYVFPISVIQKSRWPTREQFFCNYYPIVIPQITQLILSFKSLSVVDALTQVLPLFRFNLTFLWTEVLIDIAYQFPDTIDLYKRFPIGPGALPTLTLIDQTRTPEETNLSMVGAFDEQLELLRINGQKIILSAENWEGIGCEFRKYTNLSHNKGRKRRYNN